MPLVDHLAVLANELLDGCADVLDGAIPLDIFLHICLQNLVSVEWNHVEILIRGIDESLGLLESRVVK